MSRMQVAPRTPEQMREAIEQAKIDADVAKTLNEAKEAAIAAPGRAANAAFNAIRDAQSYLIPLALGSVASYEMFSLSGNPIQHMLQNGGNVGHDVAGLFGQHFGDNLVQGAGDLAKTAGDGVVAVADLAVGTLFTVKMLQWMAKDTPLEKAASRAAAEVIDWIKGGKE